MVDFTPIFDIHNENYGRRWRDIRTDEFLRRAQEKKNLSWKYLIQE